MAVPGGAVDLVVERGDLGQHGEDAGSRAQVAAPDALLAAVEQAEADGGDGRAAEHQQGRLRVFVDPDQLPVDAGDADGAEGPAGPLEPAGQRLAAPVLADPFGDGAFRAEDAAPDAAERYRGDHDAGPPDAPEDELREQAQVVPDVRVFRRQRHERRDDDERRVNDDDRPLDGHDQAAVAAQKKADSLQSTAAALRLEMQAVFNHARVSPSR